MAREKPSPTIARGALSSPAADPVPPSDAGTAAFADNAGGLEQIVSSIGP